MKHSLKTILHWCSYQQSWRILRQFLLIPLVAFSLPCLTTFMVLVSLQRNGLSAAEFVRWDSGHYLAIAATGYELFPCTPREGYPPTVWCGNTGWLPGYPLLIHLLLRLGLSGPTAGVLLSHIFLLLTLLLLWHGFLATTVTTGSLNVLLLVVVFPGSIYYQAVFPLSMFLFFVCLSFYFIKKAHWIGAGAAGFLSAFTYSPGFLLALVFPVLLMERSKPLASRLAALLIVSGLTVLGLVAVLGVHALTVGVWDAFFKVQAKYGHGLHNPWRPFGEALRFVLHRQWANPIFSTHLQTLLTAGLLLMLLATYKDARPASSVERILALYGVLFWLFPLMLGAGVHLYRQEALLVPLALLFPRLPLYLQSWILVLFCFLKFAMSMLFFQGVLV